MIEWATLDPDDGGPAIQLVPSPDMILGVVDLGWPDARTVTSGRPGSSGEIDRTVFHGSRAVSVDVKAVHQPADRSRLIGSCTASRRPTFRFRRVGEQTRRMSLVGRVASAVMDPRAAPVDDIVCTWSCPSGLVESDLERSKQGTPSSPGQGFTYPIVYPVDYGIGGTSGQLSVTNSGDLPVWPTIRVDGPATDPKLTNETTGGVMALSGFTIPAGQYATFDPQTREIYANGLRDASLLPWLAAGTVWWQLWPGVSTVRFAPSEWSAPARQVIRFRDAYTW